MSSVIFLLLGLYTVWQSRLLVYYTDIGPGPGFFPFWLGLILVGLSVALLARSFLVPQAESEDELAGDRDAVRLVVAVLVAVAAFALLIGVLGFRLTTLGVLTALLLAYGCRNPTVVLPLALGGSFGVHYAFTRWLQLPLPGATLEPLQALGL